MIHLPASVRVYLCLTACDMRKSFDGLHALVQEHLELDAFLRGIFLFLPAGEKIASRFCIGIVTDSPYGASGWKKAPTQCRWRKAPNSAGGKSRRRN
jgi:hypothetical protein